MLPNLVRVGFGVAVLCQLAAAQTVLRSIQFAANSGVYFVGDLDADGFDDIATISPTVLRLYSTASGTQIATYPYGVAAYGPPVRACGDVNGDGRDDLAMFVPSGSGYVIHVLASPSGAVLHALPFPASSPSYYTYYYFAPLDDLNGDGKAELAIGNPNAVVAGMVDAGRLDVHDGATGAIWRTHLGTAASQLFGKVFALGDLDGDGVKDYSVGGWVGAPAARSGATGALLHTMIPAAVSGAWDVGDVDADGRDDYKAVSSGQPKGGTAWTGDHICSGRTGAVLQDFVLVAAGTGMCYARPVGDLDADGHDDLALYVDWGAAPGTTEDRVLSGRDWSMLRVQPHPFRILGSPGDLDGDGCADLWILVNSSYYQVVSGVPAGVTLIGSGCPDASNITPRVGIGLGAKYGYAMGINVSDVDLNRTLAVLVLGYGNQSWGGVALPWNLGAIGLPGCQWYIEGATQLLMPTVGLFGTRRHAHYSIPVPAYPWLLGLVAFGQWAVFDPVTGVSGAVTRAVRFQVVP